MDAINTIASPTAEDEQPSVCRPAEPTDRSRWNEAMAALQKADAASAAFEPEYDRLYQEWKAETEAVPHTAFFSEYHGKTLSTEDRAEVSRCRSSIARLGYVEECAYDGPKAEHRLVTAADKRNRAIAEIEQRLGWDAANGKFDALSEAVADARAALLKLPAPDGQALLWKLRDDGIKDRLSLYGDEIEQQLRLDLQRHLADAEPSTAFEAGRIAGREEFGRTWLRLFTGLGGSVSPDRDDERVFVFFPLDGTTRRNPEYAKHLDMLATSPWFQALDDEGKQRQLEKNGPMFRDRYDGGLRQLHALLTAYPEGRAAVRQLVIGDQSLGLPAASDGEEA